ncbi:MAG: DUF2283 domain-containing protein [Caldilineaceae bacterium]|nr:DUF2283 domain-containing protein [Caldilineaceae bacterium]
MKIRYFADTDTMYIEFSERPSAETREINENILLDLDADGVLVAITAEHAAGATDLSEVSLQQIAGQPASS